MKEETILTLEKIRDDAKRFFASVNYPSKREESKGNELHVQFTRNGNVYDYDEPVENEEDLWPKWCEIRKKIEEVINAENDNDD